MSVPLTFDIASPRFSLPLLFAGQAQKEVFVNEALAITDALLHCAIEGEADAPPGSPSDGDAWLVGLAPNGPWTGQEGRIACWQAGNWLFVQPRDGMRVLDRSSGQEIRFHGIWRRPSVPLEPSGGSVVDSEARAAIQQLIAALRLTGIFPDL